MTQPETKLDPVGEVDRLHRTNRLHPLLSPRHRTTRQLAFAVVVFGTLEIYGHSTGGLLVPPVSAVVVAFIDITFGGPLIPALSSSLQLLFLGFALAAISAIILGVAVGASERLSYILSPFLSALYALPDIALVPLIIVWFGFGIAGRLVIVFLTAFFPIFLNVYSGIRDAPGHLIEVGRSFGVNPGFDMVQKVRLPAAMPNVMTGLRVGVGRAVIGMAVAEVFLALGGIGELIVRYGYAFRTDYLTAAILPLPALGIGLTLLVARIERRIVPWRPT